MTLREAEKLAREMIQKYVPGTEFAFNNRKTSLGVAKVRGTMMTGVKQSIELSMPFVKSASDSNIKDTIAHECAHILAYRTAGTLAHDRHFYKACTITGAKQERLKKDLAESSKEALKGCYCMVLIENGVVTEVLNANWHKRPRVNAAQRYLTGRKTATLGKLYYCMVKDAKIGRKISELFWQK